MYEQRYNPYSANVEIVKDYLKSGKVLFLGILHLLSLGMSVATLLLNPANVAINSMLDAFSSMGLDVSEYYNSYGSYVTASSVAWALPTVISSVFTILTAIAFIVMFAKSRNTNPDSNPSSGASILRVLSLITFICTIIGVILIVALYVLFIIGISSVNDNFNGDVQAATITQVIIGIVVSLIIIFLISYTGSQKNFYRSIRNSLNSVELQRSGAVGFGVWNIIFAVFVGISMLSSLILTVTSFNLTNILLTSSSLLSFLMLIMNASFALGYNSHIKREKYGYNDPYGGSYDAPYHPADNRAQGYGAPSGDYNYPNYNMPPQQSMPTYSEPSDNYYQPQQIQQEQQPQAAFCPNCGSPIEGGHSFCSNCGCKF